MSTITNKNLIINKCCVLLAVFAISTTVQSEEFRPYVPGQMVCSVTNPIVLDSLNQEYGCVLLTYNFRLNDYLLVTDTARDMDSLTNLISLRPSVEYCEPNYFLFAPEAVQASQPFVDQVGGDIYPEQTAVQTLKLDSTHEYTTGGSARVGIVDVGIEFSHSLMQTNVFSAWDYVDNDNLAADEPGGGASGHGTFVAGIVRLVAPHAEIYSFRALDTTGSGNGFFIAQAITDAVDSGCNVINLSLVMSGEHPSVESAVEYAHAHNVIVIAAAGNDSLQVNKFPASSDHTLSVAAVDSFGVIADFSNYGDKVDLMAPGTGIYASYIDNQYARWDGTSFAAPFVSGQAALIYAINPDGSWDDIHGAICSLAVSIDSLNPGYEGLLGYGLIDPLATVLGGGVYVCGDVNGDGMATNNLDLVYLINYIFRNGPIPANFLASNCDGILGTPNILDLTCIINYIFRLGDEPSCVP